MSEFKLAGVVISKVVGSAKCTDGFYALAEALGLSKGQFPDVDGAVRLFLNMIGNPRLWNRLDADIRAWVLLLDQEWTSALEKSDPTLSKEAALTPAAGTCILFYHFLQHLDHNNFPL